MLHTWGLWCVLDSRVLNLSLSPVHSGFFDIKTAWEKKLRFGLGTDVGAGTSFCHLQTLNEAYKVILSPVQHYCLFWPPSDAQ
jgi:guanine deaminase